MKLTKDQIEAIIMEIDPEVIDGVGASEAAEKFYKAMTDEASGAPILAGKHTGLRVDYTGLLKNARRGLHREPGTAEMLRQLEGHLTELGKRWYAGDAAVVDEILQLYCIETATRDGLVAINMEIGR